MYIYIIYFILFHFWGVGVGGVVGGGGGGGGWGGGWIASTKACGLDDMFPPDSLWFDLDSEHQGLWVGRYVSSW